jgi:hypothetical protein
MLVPHQIIQLHLRRSIAACWLGSSPMLGGEQGFLQAPKGDGLSFDQFAPPKRGWHFG